MVLDEPNASLDQPGEAALMEAVAALRRAGTTVLIVTHKIGLLTKADQILVMGGGGLKSCGPVEQVLAQMIGPRPGPTLIPTAAHALQAHRGSEAQRNAG